MTFKEYLDSCIKNYYSKIIDKYHFNLVESYSDGIGAFYTYQNDSFRLRVLNDRGIVNCELASLSEPDSYLDIDLFVVHIELTEINSENINTLDKKMIISKVLSCDQEVMAIDNYYKEISDLLLKENYEARIKVFNKNLN